MKVKMYMKLQKTGELIGKDEQSGDFVLRNTKGETVKVSPLVFQLWDMIDGVKTVKEVIREYLKFYGFGSCEERKMTREILEALVKKSLLKVKA